MGKLKHAPPKVARGGACFSLPITDSSHFRSVTVYPGGTMNKSAPGSPRRTFDKRKVSSPVRGWLCFVIITVCKLALVQFRMGKLKHAPPKVARGGACFSLPIT